MIAIDPNAAPTDATAVDPATVAAEATPEPEITEADGMLAAIAAEEAPKEEVTAAEAAKPDEEAKTEAVDPDAEITAEAETYGLKGKANERFREMAGEIKQQGQELTPIREAMAKAGITDVADLPRQFTLAQQGQEMVQLVMDTGASPEQYGMTLEYMGAINAAMGGDAAAGERAWTMFMAEGVSLAKVLGKEMPGVHDPLSEHADLQADVEAGDLTRARALELASVRQREATRTAADTHRNQVKTQTDAQATQTAAETKARTDLNALGEELSAADPHFQAKLPQLIELRDLVRKAFPPEQWATELRARYVRIPAPVAAAPKLPAPGPVRANGPLPTMAPTFATPLDAMMAGIEAAS